jgi:uncharacterized protein YwqG
MIDSTDKASIQAALVKAGLPVLANNIGKVTRTSIRLYATPVDESTLKTGASKLGGSPDLPPGIAWPAWKGTPQSFIAQIRLDEAHPFDTEGLLPQSGMLWFFYDARQETFGENPADRGGWHVLFKDGDLGSLQQVPAPATLPVESRFHACSLRFASEITLTQQPDLEIPGLNWSDANQEGYENLLATLPNQSDRASIHHRLLGFPDTIQDDMRMQCQLVSHGVTDEDDSRAEALSKGAADWRLLLQIDSDEHAGMNWGNNGMLYYWITLADLKAQHFDTTWLVLQSE